MFCSSTEYVNFFANKSRTDNQPVTLFVSSDKVNRQKISKHLVWIRDGNDPEKRERTRARQKEGRIRRKEAKMVNTSDAITENTEGSSKGLTQPKRRIHKKTVESIIHKMEQMQYEEPDGMNVIEKSKRMTINKIGKDLKIGIADLRKILTNDACLFQEGTLQILHYLISNNCNRDK